MKIGKINIKYPILLAPMAGVTDKPFRTICKSFGASLVYTEFVSADGIIRENQKTLDMIKFDDFERPLGVQIFGDNPDVIAKSAKFIYDNYKPDLIDINFGCPVPKITKKGAGSAALKDLNLMKDIVSFVINEVPEIPITAKMRSGWDSGNLVAIEAGILLESLGIQAITLHARTTKQSYSGSSDWNLIKELKNNLNIPVIGNGDVNSVSSYSKITKLTNCDAVMIGRASLGNPWIFQQIIQFINNEKYSNPSINDIIDICLKHIALLENDKPGIASVNLSKKHLSYYLKNFKNSSNWRKKIMRCNDTRSMKRNLNLILKEVN